MLSVRYGRVKDGSALFVASCALALAAGCFWRSYAGRVAVHTDVLVAIARKADDLVEADRFTAESLPELTYPLERATAFAREAHAHATTPPASLAAFDELLRRYAAYVEAVDRARGERRGAAAKAALAAPLTGVEDAAAAVRAALAREAGGARDAGASAAG
jgi:hypothetical protein